MQAREGDARSLFRAGVAGSDKAKAKQKQNKQTNKERARCIVVLRVKERCEIRKFVLFQ
jgi:ribosomal protein S25